MFIKFVNISIIFVLIFSGYGSGSSAAQESKSEEGTAPPLLIDATVRPDLSIAINSVAKIKLVVRKDRFALDELLVIDVGLLYTGASKSYVPSVRNVEVSIKDANGREVVLHYVIPSRSASVGLFSRNQLETESRLVLVGCREKPFQLQAELSSIYDEAVIFDRGLFATWGSSCINVVPGTKLTLVATLENQKVATTGENRREPKTAVGILKSDAITIIVTDR